VIAEKRKEIEARALHRAGEQEAAKRKEEAARKAAQEKAAQEKAEEDPAEAKLDEHLEANAEAMGDPAALEQEAGQEGAFDPETGEINWDCPCLGGMAHGPCGEEFKAAFSCFVHSTEEPKGMDCIDKFQ
jgi:mitochondrial intermembrane space import and assembly protein 40